MFFMSYVDALCLNCLTSSCIVSQLVFSLGGSIFPGGNGSMMIEAVPFFHILINIIQAEVGDDVSCLPPLEPLS